MSSARIARRGGIAIGLLLLVAVTTIGTDQGAGTPRDSPGAGHQGAGRTRNVVLIVGDGISDPQVTAARLLYQGAGGMLYIDSLPDVAQMTTHSHNSLVTDSAAAATAMATGTKTVNGAISVDPNGNRLETILEQAKGAGYLVGLVTTSQITDATPAAFAAHVPHRGNQTEIARQYLALQVDVLLGGGESYFLPTTQTGRHPAPGRRTDGRNLIAEAQAAGYHYVWDEITLAQVNPERTRRLLGLFADEQMYVVAAEGDPRIRVMRPPLAQMTQKAVEVLSRQSSGQKRGFLLVAEEEATDDFSHANNAEQTLAAAKRLDDAVGVALAFALRNSDTLIIVVGDHATGAMGIVEGNPASPCPRTDQNGAPVDGVGGAGGTPFLTPQGKAFCISWGTQAHSGTQVGVAALGPSPDVVKGKIDNTSIFHILRSAASLPDGIILR